MGRQVLRRYGEPWEEMEREHVHKYYKLLGARSCANYLGRPISGVRAMARKLGVATRREWTKKEIRFVQDNYERIGGKCGKHINRSRGAIRAKAKQLGMSYTGRPWEEGEDSYVVGVVREVAAALGRSPQSLAKRLERLVASGNTEAL